MLESTFRHSFRQSGGVRLNDRFILFRKPLEVYDLETDESFPYKTLDAAIKHNIEGTTIAEIIRSATPDSLFSLVLDGGRGGDSDGWEGGFAGGTDDGEDKTWEDFPARANHQIRAKNQEEALEVFRKLHVNDDYESAFSVDENGYVTKYVHGNARSVSIVGNKGDMVYHNHPSGGNFSDADLISTSLTHERGVVASGTHGDYIFIKGTHFKANAFVKAVRNAKLKGKDYNDAADKWLKRNAKKYGYTYQFKKAK